MYRIHSRLCSYDGFARAPREQAGNRRTGLNRSVCNTTLCPTPGLSPLTPPTSPLCLPVSHVLTLTQPVWRCCCYRAWPNMHVYKYLESVLKLHHAAVEEGWVELRGYAQDFGFGLTGLSCNRVPCPKEGFICVHNPLRVGGEGLLFTQVEFGCYCVCRVVEYLHRDAHCFACSYSGGGGHTIRASVETTH